MENQKKFKNLVDAFRHTINSNGHAFQYAVLEHVRELYEQGKSPWAFEVSEFPVTVRGRDTRIDFILRHRDRQLFLIGECKRANPALSNWGFVKAPYIARNQSRYPFVAERISLRETEPRSAPREMFQMKDAYHIALDLPANKKGDCKGDSKGQIEKAVAQVLTGSNGFAEFVRNNVSSYNTTNSVVVLPVVFTTAELWTTEVALEKTVLDTGEIGLDESQVHSADFVYYQYHISETIRHSYPRETVASRRLSEVLLYDYLRSVAIVSPKGIERFLHNDQQISQI